MKPLCAIFFVEIPQPSLKLFHRSLSLFGPQNLFLMQRSLSKQVEEALQARVAGCDDPIPNQKLSYLTRAVSFRRCKTVVAGRKPGIFCELSPGAG